MDSNPATALRYVLKHTLSSALSDLITQKCKNAGPNTVHVGLTPLYDFIDTVETAAISSAELVSQFREEVKSYAQDEDWKDLFDHSDRDKGKSCLLSALKKTDPELEILKHCPQCVLNYYKSHDDEDWFTTPCSKPHAVVWAWTNGCPFWPAKVLSASNGMAAVFYFGNSHETDTLPYDRIKLCDDRLTLPMRKSSGGKTPRNQKSKKWEDLTPSIESARRYIKRLKKVFTNPPLRYMWPANEKFAEDKAVFPFVTTILTTVFHPPAIQETETVIESRTSSVRQPVVTCEIRSSSTENATADQQEVHEQDEVSEEPDPEEKLEQVFNDYKEKVMHSKEVVTVRECYVQKLLQDDRWISKIVVPRVGAHIDLHDEPGASELSDCVNISSDTVSESDSQYEDMDETDESSTECESESESSPESQEQPDNMEMLLQELERAAIERQEVKEELRRVTEEWKSFLLSVPPERICQVCQEMHINEDFRCGRKRFCSEQCLAKFLNKSAEQPVVNVTQSSASKD